MLRLGLCKGILPRRRLRSGQPCTALTTCHRSSHFPSDQDNSKAEADQERFFKRSVGLKYENSIFRSYLMSSSGFLHTVAVLCTPSSTFSADINAKTGCSMTDLMGAKANSTDVIRGQVSGLRLSSSLTLYTFLRSCLIYSQQRSYSICASSSKLFYHLLLSWAYPYSARAITPMLNGSPNRIVEEHGVFYRLVCLLWGFAYTARFMSISFIANASCG